MGMRDVLLQTALNPPRLLSLTSQPVSDSPCLLQLCLILEPFMCRVHALEEIDAGKPNSSQRKTCTRELYFPLLSFGPLQVLTKKLGRNKKGQKLFSPLASAVEHKYK